MCLQRHKSKEIFFGITEITTAQHYSINTALSNQSTGTPGRYVKAINNENEMVCA
jgi:hypothetical protein